MRDRVYKKRSSLGRRSGNLGNQCRIILQLFHPSRCDIIRAAARGALYRNDIQCETTCMPFLRFTKTFDDDCNLSFEKTTHCSMFRFALLRIVRLDVLCHLQYDPTQHLGLSYAPTLAPFHSCEGRTCSLVCYTRSQTCRG